jgi:hypothetical protein
MIVSFYFFLGSHSGIFSGDHFTPVETKGGIGNGEFEHEFDQDCTHDLPLMGLAAFTKAVAVLW